MNLRLNPLVQILQVNDWLFHKSAEGLSDTDLLRRMDDRGNSFNWIAGHVVNARYLMANVAGLEHQLPYADLFARGAAHPEASALPSSTEIARYWGEITEPLIARLGELGDAELDADSGRDVPNGDRSVLGFLSFLCLHESYHLGQLGYLRVLLGYRSVVG
jgi:hypothetical protein